MTYLNGLMPLCVNIWIFKLDLFWNFFPHFEHCPSVCFWWTSFECRCNAALDPNIFIQSLHWNSLSTSEKSINEIICNNTSCLDPVYLTYHCAFVWYALLTFEVDKISFRKNHTEVLNGVDSLNIHTFCAFPNNSVSGKTIK